MKLTDNEILALTALCNAVIDGEVSAAQRARLADWLRASEAARQFYVRFMGLSASLSDRAAEMQADEPDDAIPSSRIIRLSVWGQMALSTLAAAAIITLLLWVVGWPNRAEAPAEASAGNDEVVARLTGTRDCQWGSGMPQMKAGDSLRSRQKLELASGFAEITFDCGALVVLEGPATFEVHSAWEATLLAGTLKANVPHEAVGFRILNPRVEIVDLGTEFSLIADPAGGAEVFVLKGSVEARNSDATGPKPVVLQEKQACRFSRDGITEVKDRERKFAKLARKIRFERLAQTGGLAHWSFDEVKDNQFTPELINFARGACAARLASPATLFSDANLVDGRWQRALRFDGRLSAKIPFPGLATNFPGTIAFWVKIHPDSQLSDAGAIVAWLAQNRKSVFVPVQIGWNANPSQGVLGALRTDIFKWHIVGSTSLRDGAWHHVALVFAPRERPTGAIHVKQYVDAHFEGASASNFAKQRAQPNAVTNPADNAPDTLWLGARLTRDNKVKERFHGDLDELFILERALTQSEIKSLMTLNRLARPELAAALPE